MQIRITRVGRLIGWLVIGAAGLGAGGGQRLEPPAPPSGGVADVEAKSISRRQYRPAGISPAQPAAPARSRYRTLLKRIEVPTDRATYGDFCDYGFWPGTAYAGQNDLPPGYWVYLAPDWYIFKEDVSASSASQPAVPRLWGPEQATGAPDTWPKSGDIGTAWASKTPDGQPEWIELGYRTPLKPTALLIYETFNPGAVNRVTAIGADGKETELWSGADPTPVGSEKGISVIPIRPASELSRIRVYLDSQKVPGWNEIDAVGLVDEAGQTSWAVSATASSTFADREAPAAPGPLIYDDFRAR